MKSDSSLGELTTEIEVREEMQKLVFAQIQCFASFAAL